MCLCIDIYIVLLLGQKNNNTACPTALLIFPATIMLFLWRGRHIFGETVDLKRNNHFYLCKMANQLAPCLNNVICGEFGHG